MSKLTLEPWPLWPKALIYERSRVKNDVHLHLTVPLYHHHQHPTLEKFVLNWLGSRNSKINNFKHKKEKKEKKNKFQRGI